MPVFHMWALIVQNFLIFWSNFASCDSAIGLMHSCGLDTFCCLSVFKIHIKFKEHKGYECESHMHVSVHKDFLIGRVPKLCRTVCP